MRQHVNLFIGVTLLILTVLMFSSCFECEHEWLDATCTTPSICSLCGEETGTSLGHEFVIDNAIEATCAEVGYTDGSHCGVCGHVLFPQEIITARGHKEVVDSAIEPTCTEYGLTEGSHCSVCNEVIVHQNKVDKLGHNEGEWRNEDVDFDE